MKVKYFITSLLFSFLISGCQVDAVGHISHTGRLTQHDVIVATSDVLRVRLNPTYYAYDEYIDEYYYDYPITTTDSYIGTVRLETVQDFYGYQYANPYQGELRIVNDTANIYLDVVDDYYVDIKYYDPFDSSFDLTFRTTWVELGF